MDQSFSICATCGVEHAHPLPNVCAICADERQYLPPDGIQKWTTLTELQESGRSVQIQTLEPQLFGLLVDPPVGIGHRPLLVQTSEGNLLWDPPGYIDHHITEAVNALGGVRWIAASHPHMFGVQSEWSTTFGATVLVSNRDAEWLARMSDGFVLWDDQQDLAPGLSLHRVGGHFPGMAIALWAAPDGLGVMLNGDAYPPTPAAGWVKFQRSFPNSVPLSAGVVQRLANQAQGFRFDRLYGNFNGQGILSGAHEAVQRSANRHIEWITGVHDDLT